LDRLFLSKETKMPYSMTGFGRAEKIFATRKYSVELKSVNSRYCDLNIRMPRLFNFADAAVRKQITDSLTRGKVDVFINYQDTASESETVTVNEGLVKAYSDAAAKIADVSGRLDDLGVARLASYPDVLQVSQTSVDEGYRAKLAARVDELLTSEQKEFYDESRLAAEVAVFADKCAVDEELTRLKSHFAQAHKILAGDGACGKQMDFLVQEINREVNTCGSKANDIEITNRVLAMKNTVEEIREQIQNLV
jgi:uncharacterized protein YicC (UPF0701 family)